MPRPECRRGIRGWGRHGNPWHHRQRHDRRHRGPARVKPRAGKPVMDTGNYYPQRDGHLAELDTGALTSSGLLQRDRPDAQVVKVFNNIFFKHLASLARPHGAENRTALPIAGDSAAAKAAVTAFLDRSE